MHYIAILDVNCQFESLCCFLFNTCIIYLHCSFFFLTLVANRINASISVFLTFNHDQRHFKATTISLLCYLDFNLRIRSCRNNIYSTICKLLSCSLSPGKGEALLLRHVKSVGDVLRGRIRVLRSLQNYLLKQGAWGEICDIRHNFEYYLHNNYTANYYDYYTKLKP